MYILKQITLQKQLDLRGMHIYLDYVVKMKKAFAQPKLKNKI